MAPVPFEPALEPTFNLQPFRVHDRGGHFAPAEEPDAVINDLRDAFRPLRRR